MHFSVMTIRQFPPFRGSDFSAKKEQQQQQRQEQEQQQQLHYRRQHQQHCSKARKRLNGQDKNKNKNKNKEKGKARVLGQSKVSRERRRLSTRQSSITRRKQEDKKKKYGRREHNKKKKKKNDGNMSEPGFQIDRVILNFNQRFCGICRGVYTTGMFRIYNQRWNRFIEINIGTIESLSFNRDAGFDGVPTIHLAGFYYDSESRHFIHGTVTLQIYDITQFRAIARFISRVYLRRP